MSSCRSLLFFGVSLWLAPSLFMRPVIAESAGAIEGTVLRDDGGPAHHASVMVVQTGQTVETDHEGRFHFDPMPAGTYDVFAFVAGLSSPARLIEVRPSETTPAGCGRGGTGRQCC